MLISGFILKLIFTIKINGSFKANSEMPYRGFSNQDIINLVSTGQAAACGRGEGILGALNWIDACGRASGVKPSENVRQDLVDSLNNILIIRLEEDARERARVESRNLF